MVVDPCSKLRVKFILFEQVSVRIFLAIFEVVRVISEFWFLHKVVEIGVMVAWPLESPLYEFV